MNGIQLKKAPSEPEFIFAHQALADKLPRFECEYRFDDVRKFRFDFAWPNLKLGIEIEGAIWSKGAHEYARDLCRAEDDGWPPS